MTKRGMINLGLLIAVGAIGTISVTACAKDVKPDNFEPYTATDSEGNTVYVRRDCHPYLPEADEIEAIRNNKELAYQDVEEETKELSVWDEEGWEIGTASAYGGSGDAAIPDNQITATMEPVNEGTYGVAVPMIWNTKENLGKTILIRYEGKVVEGVINDVGGMGNGTRTLDLQPGIFHEFGATDCNDWGLRTVEYKILD